MKWTVIPFLIFVINFRNEMLVKQLVKQELAFSKKCKNKPTKQEIVYDAAFKVWPFSSDFNFACKNSQVTVATCKYYCPSVVNLTIIKLQ